MSLGVDRLAPVSSDARPPSSPASNPGTHCERQCLLPPGQPGKAARLQGSGHRRGGGGLVPQGQPASTSGGGALGASAAEGPTTARPDSLGGTFGGDSRLPERGLPTLAAALDGKFLPPAAWGAAKGTARALPREPAVETMCGGDVVGSAPSPRTRSGRGPSVGGSPLGSAGVRGRDRLREDGPAPPGTQCAPAPGAGGGRRVPFPAGGG